jgi:hypothetical protein
MYWIWKIYIQKQFLEMYWYLKNLRNETISQNKVQGNFAELKSFSSLFRFREIKKILFRDHPTPHTVWPDIWFPDTTDIRKAEYPANPIYFLVKTTKCIALPIFFFIENIFK